MKWPALRYHTPADVKLKDANIKIDRQAGARVDSAARQGSAPFTLVSIVPEHGRSGANPALCATVKRSTMRDAGACAAFRRQSIPQGVAGCERLWAAKKGRDALRVSGRNEGRGARQRGALAEYRERAAKTGAVARPRRPDRANSGPHLDAEYVFPFLRMRDGALDCVLELQGGE